MSMKKSILATGLLASLALGCAHDDDTRASRSNATAGDERRDERADAREERRDERDDGDGRDQDADRRDRATTTADGADATGRANGGGTPTAQDQSGTDQDLAITRRIRQACVNDESLSISARNVIIVTQSGVVTLRGTVESSTERSAVERHAQAAPGVSRVDNQIALSP